MLCGLAITVCYEHSDNAGIEKGLLVATEEYEPVSTELMAAPTATPMREAISLGNTTP